MLRKFIVALLALGTLVFGPNLIWFATSTVRISNASDGSLTRVGFHACGTTHTLGTLAPGVSVFRFLEACGDDVLEIRIGDEAFCFMYVEGDIYHVDAYLRGETAVDCAYDDLFTGLLLAKILL